MDRAIVAKIKKNILALVLKNNLKFLRGICFFLFSLLTESLLMPWRWLFAVPFESYFVYSLGAVDFIKLGVVTAQESVDAEMGQLNSHNISKI
jgi:hypothetical protein